MIRPAGIVAGLSLAVAASSVPASAQLSSPEFETFSLRLEDSLRSRHEASPNDALAEIAVKTAETFPLIFRVVAEQAYEARTANPSIAMEEDWQTPYVARIVPTVLAFHGDRIAQSPLSELDAFHDAHIAYLRFLSERSETLCAEEAVGSLATVGTGEFRDATDPDDATMTQFGELTTAVTLSAIRAIFAASEDRQQSSLGDDDLDAMATVLVAADFSDEEVANLLEGELPTDAGDAELCDAGLRFQAALSELPDETRRDILALYLTPPTVSDAEGDAPQADDPPVLRP